MRTASTAPRGPGKQPQRSRQRGRRGAVNGPLLAWAFIMALALLSSAVHLLHDNGLVIDRVGAATGAPHDSTAWPMTG